MRLHIIEAGHFKLDGGTMFGVVPKVIWQKSMPPDDRNHVSFAMRCLLVEDGPRLILIDCGMGDKQDARWQAYYFRHGEGNLIGSLKKAGFSPTDVTDVLPTHLHFDHVGGATQWNTRRDGYELTFPNARYWAHPAHWAWAMNPNPREKATFLTENLRPIQESGHLQFLAGGLGQGTRSKNAENQSLPHAPSPLPFALLTADGHTEKMVMPKIEISGKTVVFAADLIPTTAHVPVNYVMSYDVRPLVTMEEKAVFLNEAAEKVWVLVSDHDPVYEAYTVQQTEKGFRVLETGPLAAFL
ncbi:MAG: MBL fold metallo-hydrolase [Sphingobacteriaceae bacterium]|nr:MBL fold metallo-hydrolase [Cytophagaceae bacterium]